MDESDRRLWVLNDEGLYNMWKASGLPMRRFLREQREEIDRFIKAALDRPPSH